MRQMRRQEIVDIFRCSGTRTTCCQNKAFAGTHSKVGKLGEKLYEWIHAPGRRTAISRVMRTPAREWSTRGDTGCAAVPIGCLLLLACGCVFRWRATFAMGPGTVSRTAASVAVRLCRDRRGGGPSTASSDGERAQGDDCQTGNSAQHANLREICRRRQMAAMSNKNAAAPGLPVEPQPVARPPPRRS